MSDDAKNGDNEKKPDHEPPAGAETTGAWGRGRKAIQYTATGKWTVLRKKEKPAAEIFSVSYVADGGRSEPAPSCSSSTAVPVRRRHTCTWAPSGRSASTSRRTGSLPTMPPRLVENESSWLSFSDLVFVDPVGTGFSRVIETETKSGDGKDGAKPDDAPDPKEYFGYKRDLESLCEFMGRWLSEHGRWGSPVFIAGESYGGYRVGRLARMLQETAGIGLNGAILISPALEITGLDPTDYESSAGSTACRRWPAAACTTAARARSARARRSRRRCARPRSSRPATTRRSSLAEPRFRRRSARESSRSWPTSSASRSTSCCARRAASGSSRTYVRFSVTSARCSDSTTRRSRRPTRSPTARVRLARIRRSPASAPRTPWRSTGCCARRSASRPTASTRCSRTR